MFTLREKYPDLNEKIEAALTTIRPYLQADKGDISLYEVTDEGIVKIKLSGACESCPMSFMTMKAGVEETIRRIIPEIVAVETVT